MLGLQSHVLITYPDQSSLNRKMDFKHRSQISLMNCFQSLLIRLQVQGPYLGMRISLYFLGDWDLKSRDNYDKFLNISIFIYLRALEHKKKIHIQSFLGQKIRKITKKLAKPSQNSVTLWGHPWPLFMLNEW